MKKKRTNNGRAIKGSKTRHHYSCAMCDEAEE
jgi:hypothetical protein